MSLAPHSVLVLGGAKSGKSSYAQALAEGWGGRLIYVATAQAHDEEMTRRIARHQADRERMVHPGRAHEVGSGP